MTPKPPQVKRPVPSKNEMGRVPQDADNWSSGGISRSSLRHLYARRFAGRLDYRDRVWRTLIKSFFVRWIAPSDDVLDLGCGYGEFINNLNCFRRWAMDLNPDSRTNLQDGIELIEQDCSRPWPLQDCSLDVVFTSNFLEHLVSKEHVTRTLAESARCLRPGGRLIVLGPNIRYVGGAYWDYYDHHVPLTDTSIAEALRVCGFEIEVVYPRFLPYSMSDGFHYPTWMLRAYLRLPIAWRYFGKQFFVVVVPSGLTVGPDSLLPGSAGARCAVRPIKISARTGHSRHDGYVTPQIWPTHSSPFQSNW